MLNHFVTHHGLDVPVKQPYLKEAFALEVGTVAAALHRLHGWQAPPELSSPAVQTAVQYGQWIIRRGMVLFRVAARQRGKPLTSPFQAHGLDGFGACQV